MNNCPIPDDDFIEEYLQEPLTPEKKAELAKIREERERQQEDTFQTVHHPLRFPS